MTYTDCSKCERPIEIADDEISDGLCARCRGVSPEAKAAVILRALAQALARQENHDAWEELTGWLWLNRRSASTLRRIAAQLEQAHHTTHCHNARHDTPCPFPCSACADECGEGKSRHE